MAMPPRPSPVKGSVPFPAPVPAPAEPGPHEVPCAHLTEFANAADEKTSAQTTAAATTRNPFTPTPSSSRRNPLAVPTTSIANHRQRNQMKRYAEASRVPRGVNSALSSSHR